MVVQRNFIVLEGIDGSGTTTLMNGLKDYLKELSVPFKASCEPTDGPLGKMVRRVLSSEIKLAPKSLAMLFAADRNEHLYQQGMVKDCESNIVISDRYLFSSLVYQAMDCGWDFVYQLNGVFPLPEKLIFLDISAEEAAERKDKRGSQEEIYEKEGLQKDIIQRYHNVLDFFSSTSMKILRLDASKTPGELISQAGQFILNK